ncbi:MAG: PQQ-dependent sugar dehydrogenase [Actinomycetota bacterium]|nr:PQQ-dependent sugar dehydrogenase [Actinomycetota bacterium]
MKRISIAISAVALALSTAVVPSSAASSIADIRAKCARRPPLADPVPQDIERSEIRVRLKTVATRLTAPNWGTFNGIHRNRLFVVDQDGILWSINLVSGRKRIFLDVSDLLVPLGAFGPGTYDERGFLGVAFHPDYAENGLLYTYTSEPATEEPDFSTMPPGVPPDHQNVVREWRVSNPTRSTATVRPGSRELLRVDWPQFNHNAGALNFGPDGLLYISMGDGGGADDQDGQLFSGEVVVGHGRRGNGQNPSNPLGDILRIDPLGSNSANGQYGIPDDNPFVGRSGFLPEIFAWGFRNPFRFSFDSATGELWAGDVGQNDVEEVDIVLPGRNYGWRIKEGPFRFCPAGFGEVEDHSDGFVFEFSPGTPRRLVDPIAYYDRDEGVAVIGGFVYRGSAIPELEGHYVFGDLSRSHENFNLGQLLTLTEDGRVVRLRALNNAVLGLGQDASGELYLLVHNTGGEPFGATGKVLKIVPAKR